MDTKVLGSEALVAGMDCFEQYLTYYSFRIY